MKPSLILMGFLFLICESKFCSAQSNPSDNKNLGLCGMYSDTLKLEDLACGMLSVKSNETVVVTSFILSYYLSNQMNLKLIYGFGNKLKDEETKEMLNTKPTKIFLQEVLGESGTENLILGHRTIYCN